MIRSVRLLAVALALAASVGTSRAAESVTFLLNWSPTADHSPFYYAKQQGWYAKAGLDVTIEIGKGSGISAQRVAVGSATFAIADLPTMMVARSKGADDVAIMSLFANTAQTFYWLKSDGIKGVNDFAGHKIGNPPGDAARVMWPAFAKAAKIDANAVNFVNISPQAKLSSLKSHAVDIITDFYNEHDSKLEAFGSDLAYLRWPDIGLNLYGNSVIANGAFIEKNPKLVEAFVQITQKAFAACVADISPCADALLAGTSGLDKPTQLRQWERIKSMMDDKFTTGKALGWFDAERMQKDYDLVQTYLGMEKPFPVATAYTTKFLDQTIKFDASKVTVK